MAKTEILRLISKTGRLLEGKTLVGAVAEVLKPNATIPARNFFSH